MRNIANQTLLILCFFISLAILRLVIGHANVGLDLTDEGYYFNWISNPWLYKYYVSQFGYVYHPLYKLLQSDIVLLRQANVLISYALGWLLFFNVLNLISQHQIEPKITFKWRLFASFSFATATLFILMIAGHWLPSPSYNSLTFNGCLVAALGVLLAFKCIKAPGSFAFFLIGLGGWLVFMAKPTSAGLLGLTVSVLFLSVNLNLWKKLLISSITAFLLLIVSAYLIDGSIAQFVERLKIGLEMVRLMRHDQGNLFRLDLFRICDYFLWKTVFLSFAIFTFLRATYQREKYSIYVITLISFIAIAVLINLLDINPRFFDSTKYHSLIILSSLLGSVLYLLFTPKNGVIHNQSNFPNRLIFFILFLPYIYSFGTGNNYWQTAAGAGVFWLVGSLLIISRDSFSQLKLMVMQVFSLLIVSTVMIDTLNSPYRQQQSIFLQKQIVVEPYHQHVLLLENNTARFLNEISELAKSSNFLPQTPLIDLTGQTPGALYFLQAKAIGQAWMIGGYPGSASLAAKALSFTTCDDLANAWLLIEKDGSRSLPDSILTANGIKVNKEYYQIVGKLKTQKISWWRGITRKNPEGIYFHYLAKPIQANLQKFSCESARKSMQQ